MENRAHALAAGLFLLVLALGLLGAVAWMQGDRTERVKYTVVARTAVSGLNVKAPVKLRGVEVGKVEAIAFDAADPRLILVTIAVDKAAPLSRGSYAQLGLQGVTGLSFIDLNDDGKGGPLLASAGSAAPRIELKPTLLDQLSAAGPALVAGVTEATTRINTVLGDANQQQLTRLLTHLGTAAENLTQLTAALQPTAKALPPLLQRADRTVADVAGTAQQFSALAVDARALTTDLRTRTALLDRIGSAAQQIEATTANLELALVGPQRQRTTPLLDELSAASRALQRVAQDVGDQPQSVLFGSAVRPPGPGELGFEARRP